ncbi:AAEL014975-PA [Aedes aegypti]|uniref:AAEL014975-PA n=1 Tax=Aedes aegypti TaxID=7159 RepID=Q16EY3_AEDAE|nr:AAEL014975-PA [Aedes aegypti]
MVAKRLLCFSLFRVLFVRILEGNLFVIDYAFRYYIDHPQTGVSLDHWENRRGDYVHGGYGVLEPGGYVRTVHYEVEGNSGFRTVIKTTAPGSSLQYNIHSGKKSQPPHPLWNAQPVAFVQSGH